MHRPFLDKAPAEKSCFAKTSRFPVRNTSLAGLHAPLIQTKLTINKPGDKYEQEADRVAEQVMRMPDPERSIQRKCAECEKEDEETLQRKPLISGITPVVQRQAENEEEEDEEPLQMKESNPGVSAQVSPQFQTSLNSVLNTGGRPLSKTDRAFFEPRFGINFSHVRIHDNGQAHTAARQINARAFTLGNNVVFGSGQYSHGNITGRSLLAHELTHTLQQGIENKLSIRRWSYGSGSPPDPTYVVVPVDEKKRIKAGLELVKRVADNPKRYPRCHRRFKNLCTSPDSNELLARYNAAIVWKETSTDPTFRFGSSVSPDNIAYTAETWRWGRWMLASTFIHEMMHRCGFHNETELLKTEKICGFPGLP